MASVTSISDLRVSDTAALFQGRDQTPVSVFITHYGRGRGPQLHLHPYPETFVVLAGTAEFTAAEEKFVVPAGNVVVVPAETAHRFECHGDDELRVVSVHPSPTVQQTDL